MNSHFTRLHLINLIAKLEQRIIYLKQKSNKFSFYRLITFAAGVVLCVLGFLVSNPFGWLSIAISVLAFSLIVHFHNKLLFGIRRCSEYLKIKEQHVSRMDINWENIPLPIVNEPAFDMTIEKDLDLVGERSLHHLIDLSISYEGSLLLRKWITNTSPDLETISFRQKIVMELLRLTRFRDKFLLKSRLISKKILKGSEIISWLSYSANGNLSSWLFPVSLTLVGLYIALFSLYVMEIIHGAWVIPFIIYFFIYSSYKKKIDKEIEDAVELENQIKKFSLIILSIKNFTFVSSPLLQKLLSDLIKEENGAAYKLMSLQKLISALLIRENPLIRIILNILFPYDLFFGKRLIKLRSELASDLPKWLKTLNELECLVSLANFSHLNPEYIFSDFEINKNKEFKAVALGHPLIKHEKKITNDFSLNKNNEIVIITGSNMSGKSTFLKTVGINLCLSYCGAPVNANSFHVPLYELFTCIKVNDSVADGISYFYAEVKMLKKLLEKIRIEQHKEVFFLIDEIFKGTNNKERLIGSRAFIKKLSHLKISGIVSTHDLELVNIADENNSITNYHFREEIMDGKMDFDYKIHSGPCPTTNALKIMEMSGLPIN